MLIDKLQDCDDLEFLEADTRELACVEEVIPLGQGLAGIAAFEIIGGIEQVLAACLALAARERAQRVETARDRADKAAFTLAVGRDRAEHRRHGLVGAVGATEALDRDVGAPSGFEQEVDEIGRAQVRTPVTNAHLVCRLLLEKQKKKQTDKYNTT